MKMYTVIVTAAALIAIGLGACNKEKSSGLNQATHSNTKGNNLRQVINVSDVGNIHNYGLTQLANLYQPDSTVSPGKCTSTNIHYLFSALNLEYGYGFDSTDSALCYEHVKMAFDDGVLVAPDSMWNIAVNSVKDKISPQELNLINSAHQAFVNSRSMDYNAQSKYLQAQADSLINVYNSLSWGQDEGTLCGGMLYVMQGSAKLWNDAGMTSYYGTPTPLGTIIQADAAGYLYGWGESLAL